MLLYCREKGAAEEPAWRCVYSDIESPEPVLYEVDLVKVLEGYAEFPLEA